MVVVGVAVVVAVAAGVAAVVEVAPAVAPTPPQFRCSLLRRETHLCFGGALARLVFVLMRAVTAAMQFVFLCVVAST